MNIPVLSSTDVSPDLDHKPRPDPTRQLASVIARDQVKENSLDETGSSFNDGTSDTNNLTVAINRLQPNSNGDIDPRQTNGQEIGTAGTKPPLRDIVYELSQTYRESGDINDLNVAIGFFTDGVNTQLRGSEDWALCSENLGSSLFTRFQEECDSIDLLQAISFLRQALECRPTNHPRRSVLLCNLASALETSFEEEGQQIYLEESIVLRRENVDTLPPSDRLRSICLNHLADDLSTRYELEGQQNDLNESIAFYKEALNLIDSSHPDRLVCINNLANAVLARFVQEGLRSDLDEAISLHRQCVDLHPTPHPDRYGSLNNLSSSLISRFEMDGNQSDLDDAIALQRESVELLPLSHPSQSGTLFNLSLALLARYRRGNQQVDLDEVISVRKQATLLRDLPRNVQSTCLKQFADALLIRFEAVDLQTDLDEAIYAYRQALKLQTPSSLDYLEDRPPTGFQHSEQQGSLSQNRLQFRQTRLEMRPHIHSLHFDSLDSLATALMTRFNRLGKDGDLDEAIKLHRQALQLLPPRHSGNLGCLNNLANAILARYTIGGLQGDLNEGISLYKQAIEDISLSHPERSRCTSNLAMAMLTRFEQSGHQTDIDECIALGQVAIELPPPPDADKSFAFHTLALALLTRYQNGGLESDLDQAISLNRQVLTLQPTFHSTRMSAISNLGSGLLARFEKGGIQSDLDESIFLNRKALGLLSHPNHQDRSIVLEILARSLSARFARDGQRSDLDDAISFHREVIKLQPPPHILRGASLNNLAIALLRRVREERRTNDLSEAISLHREALTLLLPPHLERANALNSLATALLTKFETGGIQSDLDESIALNRQGLELRGPFHPLRPTSLSNLACVLSIRFDRTGQKSDFDEAISLHEEALELRPPPHPLRHSSISNLANLLFTKFEQGGKDSDLDKSISLFRETLELKGLHIIYKSMILRSLGRALCERANNPELLDEAMASFSAAVECSPQFGSRRLQFAKSWILHANKHRHNSAFEAYEAALQALPQVAALSFDVHLRLEALKAMSDGLARDAAVLAIQTGRFEKAVEFLEGGRSIFWSQMLSLRSPFEDLQEIAPATANELQIIATALELGSHRITTFELSDDESKLSVDQEAARLNRLNEEWLTEVSKVRQLEGLDDFLLPRRFSSLQAAASEYPIVILVANDESSHCLIITSAALKHIPIHGLSNRVLRDLVQLLEVAVLHLRVSRTLIEEKQKSLIQALGDKRGMRLEVDGFRSSDSVFRMVLKVLWDEVVHPVVKYLQLQKSGARSILKWCPSGIYTFLPIHAAGSYDDEISIDCASEYFVSSYTPTIGALLAHKPFPSTQPFKMLVVIQSQGLPSTKQELRNIEQHVPSDTLIKLGVPGTLASTEDVARRLSDATIVHFACHGKQDRSKPLNSGLKLDNGLLQVSRIMREKIPNGSLAFLCACETAMGDERLPDEAMSLGSSLLFAGFRHVVGTMWEMSDEDGPTIAGSFYQELFRGSSGDATQTPDTSRSAAALHIAVQKLRSRNVAFRRWVPFIHMGK